MAGGDEDISIANPDVARTRGQKRTKRCSHKITGHQRASLGREPSASTSETRGCDQTIDPLQDRKTSPAKSLRLRYQNYRRRQKVSARRGEPAHQYWCDNKSRSKSADRTQCARDRRDILERSSKLRRGKNPLSRSRSTAKSRRNHQMVRSVTEKSTLRVLKRRDQRQKARA